MNKMKYVFTIALTKTLVLTFCLFNSAVGQDASIIRALPDLNQRVSNRLVIPEPLPPEVYYRSRQDISQSATSPPAEQQQSPSDQQIQDPATDLKSLQQADDESLDQELRDDTLATLFKKGEWPRKGIQEIKIEIREKSADSPEGIAAQLTNSFSGQWSTFDPMPRMFCWAAPDIRYQPLYFEDVPLERYGQTKSTPVQTVKSAAHFFTSIALLPYHMRHDHPGSCDYPLGFCRPGDCAPCTIQRQLYGHPQR